jgi:hypothetical protein
MDTGSKLLAAKRSKFIPLHLQRCSNSLSKPLLSTVRRTHCAHVYERSEAGTPQIRQKRTPCH